MRCVWRVRCRVRVRVCACARDACLCWWQEAKVKAKVCDWLEQLIDELESELELPAPSYSQYELERQRSIVSNARVLLQLAQAELRNAPEGSSAVRIAFLESECGKAEARVIESERELEKVEQRVH